MVIFNLVVMDNLQIFPMVFTTNQALFQMLLDFSTVGGAQCQLDELFNWMLDSLIVGAVTLVESY